MRVYSVTQQLCIERAVVEVKREVSYERESNELSDSTDEVGQAPGGGE